MKNLLILLFCFSLSSVYGQFIDDFTDGDFTTNPTWTGNTANFEVNPGLELHLNAPGQTDTSVLTTPSSAINNATWTFLVKFDFNPSGSNYSQVYVVADNNALKGEINGYYVLIGGADDAVSLFRQDGNSATKIIDGTNDILNTSSVNVRIKVTRDALGNWALFSDPSGATSYTSEGTVYDDTYFQSNYFGVYCRYTSTRSDKFIYDDFKVSGTPFVDNIQPVVDTVLVKSSTQLDIAFSEPVSQSTAENTINYMVNNGIGNPTSAVRDASDKSLVHLTFATNFVTAQGYILTTQNVQDGAGNTMSQDQHSFMYLVAATPVYGDILINEFMPDENPSIGLPLTEYVELYNKSNKYFHLKDWKLRDDNSNGTIQDIWLYPGDYLLLVSSSSVDSFATLSNIVGVTSWASLNNSGDEIHLLSKSGVEVNQLKYDGSWYHDANKSDGGWSIERINPTLPCSSSDNWTASNSIKGGTPGVQNSVFDASPDTKIPEVIKKEVLLPNQLKLTFSEPLDSSSLVNASFTSGSGLTVSAIAINTSPPTTITFTFTNNLNQGVLYQFSFGSFSDCSGNANSYNGDFVLPQEPEYGDIIINEFIPRTHPTVGLADVQYVELYNRSKKYFYLKNWTLSDNSASGTIQGGWLYPGEYLLLVPTSGMVNYPQGVEVDGWESLNITGDEIHLSTDNGLEVDGLTYTDAWYKDDQKKDKGWSIERINPKLPCSNEENWRASVDPSGGTPGTPNSVLDTTADVSTPTIVKAKGELPNKVKIIFSEGMDSLSIVNLGFSSTPPLLIDSMIIKEHFPSEVTLVFQDSLVPGQVYNFTLNKVADCSGNLTEIKGNFVIPQNPQMGDLIINEILFNPFTGGADFVEIYNKSDRYINMKGWQLAKFEDDTISSIKEIGVDYILSPEGYAVVTEDSNFQIMNYPVAVPGKFIQTDIPSYNNDSSTVYLIYKDTVMDKVSYSEEWHFDLLHDVDGVSLERISSELPSNSSDNWHSASQTIGFATPGRKNSQVNHPGKKGGTLSLSSGIFSPDNDGFQDQLLLTYKVNAPDLTGSLTIYDDRGRQIKVLFSNELLGAEGTSQWDGLREDGRKANIGPYIILLEIFDLDNAKVQTIRKVVTLAGKL